MKHQLLRLHEDFINSAERQMNFGKLPVTVKQSEVPLIAVERWRKVGSPATLTKTFQFRRPADRNLFVIAILQYEEEVQHHSMLQLDEETVVVSLITKDTEQITEIDKEFARYCDVVFKDIVYRPDVLSIFLT